MGSFDEKDLGPPDIKLEGLQIWVHGRQFPDLQDYWDGNWLKVTAHCGAAGASVWTTGPIIHLGEIQHWLAQLQQMQVALSGKADLECTEPELSVSLKAASLGHIMMEVSITPNHLAQEHRFKSEIDQSYLPPLIKQCAEMLREYPIRGNPK